MNYEADSNRMPAVNGVRFLELLHDLPGRLNEVQAIDVQELWNGRSTLANDIKEAVKLLSTDSGTFRMDMVGLAIAVGSGLVALGGISASSLTSGDSLGLTVIGTATGAVGVAVSLGANLTEHFQTDRMTKRLRNHYAKLQNLKWLCEVSQYHRHFEELVGWNENKFAELFTNCLHVMKYGDATVKAIHSTQDDTIRRFVEYHLLPSFGSKTEGKEWEITVQNILSRIGDIFRALREVLKLLQQLGGEMAVNEATEYIASASSILSKLLSLLPHKDDLDMATHLVYLGSEMHRFYKYSV